ncbi:hypothetical protein ACF1DV_26030 [Streptomyces achromogenes]|uniref:hypothetical protein n=1 Tax=Streptomyces achromogenes TaxID=67255 RepID=UPI0036F9EED7
MTEYTAQCRHYADDYIRAHHNGKSVVLDCYVDGEHMADPFLSPDTARTFARGILALADEVDGGEAKEEPQPAPLTVGDQVEITGDTGGLYFGRCGTLLDIDTGDTEYPYLVRLEGRTGGGVWVHAVRKLEQPAPAPADEPEAPTNPRLTHLHQAEVALTEYEHTAADIIALARFLAGE